MKEIRLHWVTQGVRERAHLIQKNTYKVALCGVRCKWKGWRDSGKNDIACAKCLDVFEREQKFRL